MSASEQLQGIVYKILPTDTWRTLPNPWRGSADDLRDGFVHLSTAHQVARTVRKWFTDAPDLTLLALDIARMPEGSLRWEGDPMPFPHLYCALTQEMVVEVHQVKRGPEGHELPTGLRDA